MELFLLYIWLKLEAISLLLLLLACGSACMAVVSAIAMDTSLSDPDRVQTQKTWGKRRNRFFVAAIPLLILSALVPSKTDVAVLVGASMAIKFANSPEGEKVSALLRGKVNEILDEELKKLNPVK